MDTPDALERQHTLLTAASRYDELRTREALAAAAAEFAEDAAGAGPAGAAGPALGRSEALELLALGEVVARKAGYGRQLSVRSARAAGASWTQIGAALGTSKQAAWEAHRRWIDDQAAQHRRSGYEGLDEDQQAAARALAGDLDADS